MQSIDTQDRMAVLMISDTGTIQECNKAFEKLFGYLSVDILCKHVSMLLPQLAGIPLMNGEEINPRLRWLSRIGHPFVAIGLGSIQFASQLFIHKIENPDQHYLRLVICPS